MDLILCQLDGWSNLHHLVPVSSERPCETKDLSRYRWISTQTLPFAARRNDGKHVLMGRKTLLAPRCGSCVCRWEGCHLFSIGDPLQRSCLHQRGLDSGQRPAGSLACSTRALQGCFQIRWLDRVQLQQQRKLSLAIAQLQFYLLGY